LLREKPLDIFHRAAQSRVDHLLRHPGIVRCEHDVRQRKQRIVGPDRFFMKGVECRADELPAP
jgi:hypothetical protein